MPGSMSVQLNKLKLEQLIQQSPQKAGVALRRLALIGMGIAQRSMGTSPPGRRYKRGSTIHIASQPGHAPNVDTGTLRNSLRVERRGTLNQAIVVGAEHALHLEYGTRNMSPRPFMRPMVLELEKQVDDVFDRYLEK